MRIWDINPGYLNRQSLLGEHRELHGMVSIFVNHKKGYSQHPETKRWVGYGWALRQRHQLLVAEMTLRGYTDKSPVRLRRNKDTWPLTYIDEPYQQLAILGQKYQHKEPGRIPLPKNVQQLWSQHKYSIMARDLNLYKTLGKDISRMNKKQDFAALTMLLTEQLRIQPAYGGIRNALQHMWGYVSDYVIVPKNDIESWGLNRLLCEVQRAALAHQVGYLLASTALSELLAWMPKKYKKTG